MVELTAEGLPFELKTKGQEIKYTKQIADIFDLGAVVSSYTNSFTIPKTPNNTERMQQLGIVGDTSQIPYQQVSSSLAHHGFPTIPKGWLKVIETAEEYKVSITDGMIDFFKSIENKTMGTDLNLSQFNHTKDLPTVIDSFDGEYFRYLIADYAGKVLGVDGDDEGINIDYLVPCFNMGKLFELVMDTFGFTYDDTNITELDEIYITYPKSPSESIIETLIADFTKSNYIAQPFPVGGGVYEPSGEYYWTTQDVDEGTVLENWRWVVPQDAAYRLDFIAEIYARYANIVNVNEVQKPMNLTINVNSIPVASGLSDPLSPVTIGNSLYLSQGDIVSIEMRASPYQISGSRYLHDIHHNSSRLRIYRTNQGNVSLSDVFKDFAIKDFFKECLIRMAVVPIISNGVNGLNTHLSFKRLSDRISFDNAVDFTDKFVSREKETYINGSYAQKNTFRLKYNDEQDTSQDGYLMVNNANLSDEKILIQSKLYAAENSITRFYDIAETEYFETKRFPIWLPESKQDAAGNITVEYKGLSNRFYLMKQALSPVSTWRLVSEQVAGSDTVTQLPYAITEGTTFSQIVPDRYFDYKGVLDNFRCHNIKMALGLADFIGMDLTVPVYFGQEAQYYIVNRVDFQEGDLSNAECIRINRVAALVPPAEALTVPVQFMMLSDETVRILIPIIDGFDDYTSAASSITINGGEATETDVEVLSEYIQVMASFAEDGAPVVSGFSININDGVNYRNYIYTNPDVIFHGGDILSGRTKILTAYSENA